MHRFDVKTIKTFELGRKTTKVIFYYDEFHRFDVKTIKTCWVRSQNYKRSNYNELHRFDVKTIKMLRYVAKLQKWSNYNYDLIKTHSQNSIWCHNDQNYAKLQKWSNYDEFASIWRQNYQKCWGTSQNYKKLRKWSNYNELHRFDVKTIKTFELGRKTTKVILFRWICIDLTSKRSKTLRYVAKHSKQRKTTKLIKLQWIASIWRQNDQNFWVRSQNYKSDQITMHCIDLMS